jgi:hypothetical protein
MADYYTEFSFAIPLTSDEQTAWAAEAIAWLAEPEDREPPEDSDLTRELMSVPDDVGEYVSFRAEVDADYTTWDMETRKPVPCPIIWVHSDESGNPEEAGRFAQAFLRKFDPDGYIGFTYGDTCSKPRIDAFAGGAVFVTAHEVDGEHASGWLHKRIDRHLATPIHVWTATSPGAVAMEWGTDSGEVFRRLLPAIHEDDVTHDVVFLPNDVRDAGIDAVEDYLRSIGAF